jgi:hypothetical protein
MALQLDKSSLQYLGEEYQYKLVKEFMEDRNCFKDLAPIIDQNMFTGQYLRMYVGTMLEYFNKHGEVPSYSSMSVELRQKSHTQADIEICEGIVNKIRNTSSEGSDQTRDLATKFFKQQNIIKAAHEMLRLAGNGDLENYDRCEQLLRDALNTGVHEDYEEARLFDGLDETLSDDFRVVIPTGVGLVDETLNGGIGKGELGAIVGPSGYGKTSMTTAMALHAAGYKSEQNNNKGFKVLQIVFEDRIKQIQRKHFSRITQVEACNLSKDEYAKYVRDILDNYEDRETIQENLRIIRLKSGEKSIDFIIDLIQKHINSGFRPDIVFLDYFECVKLTGPATMSKWDKESLIMRKIESAANDFNVAFWVSIQGNRDSINAELVTMDNGGGSIGKIQIAHIIMSITRSLEDIAENIATIAILKNRAGSSGRVIRDAIFNNGTCTISTDNVDGFETTVDFGREMKKRKEEDLQGIMAEMREQKK